MTYDYCGVILHICTICYNTSRNVGALKIVQCTAVVSSALLANGQGVVLQLG